MIPHGSPLEVCGHEVGLCQEQGRSDLVSLEDLRGDDEHPGLRAHLDLATLLGEVVGRFRVGDRRFRVAQEGVALGAVQIAGRNLIRKSETSWLQYKDWLLH